LIWINVPNGVWLVGVVSRASVVEDILISIKDADCDAVLGL